MAKDLVQEAYAQIDAMRDAATETAKNILIEAMSTDLKAAVAQAMSETLVEDEDQVEEVVENEVSTDEETIDEGAVEDTDEDETENLEESEVNDTDAEETYVEGDMEDEDDEEDDEEEDEDDEDEEMMDEEVVEVVEAEEMAEGNETDDIEVLRQENAALRQENKKYEKALIGVKKQMDEINLFNARLAAATDLMRTIPLTKGQKEKVVENFDAAKSIGEVKRMHKILSEAYKSSEKNTSKPRVSRPNVQSVVTEGTEVKDNTVYDRLAKLAGTL